MSFRSRILCLATTGCYNTSAWIYIASAGIDVTTARIDHIATRIVPATAFFFTFFCVRIFIHKIHPLQLKREALRPKGHGLQCYSKGHYFMPFQQL